MNHAHNMAITKAIGAMSSLLRRTKDLMPCSIVTCSALDLSILFSRGVWTSSSFTSMCCVLSCFDIAHLEKEPHSADQTNKASSLRCSSDPRSTALSRGEQ